MFRFLGRGGVQGRGAGSGRGAGRMGGPRAAGLPEIVRQAWETREGPAVLTTVSGDGTPNAVYIGSIRPLGDDRFVVGDNYFCKTRENILAGCKGSLLFITTERKSYQLKGSFEYLTSGEIFGAMHGWLRAGLPGHAAVVLHVEEVFRGAERLL